MKYAPERTHDAMVTKKKIRAMTVFVFSVKIKYVRSAKPQTTRYYP